MIELKTDLYNEMLSRKKRCREFYSNLESKKKAHETYHRIRGEIEECESEGILEE